LEIIQLGTKLYWMVSRSFKFIFLFLFIFIVSCSSSEASKRALISAAASDEQDAKWVANYKKSKANCKTFKNFIEQEAPTAEIKAVVGLRYAQKCNKSENVLKSVKFDWLKKDAVISGLKEANDPDLFSQYYENYLNLDAQSRATLEFLERTNLYTKNLKKINPKTQKELLDKMLYMFPAFYVDYGKEIPDKKQFEAAYGLRMQRKFEQSRKIYKKIIDDAKKNLDTLKSAKSKAEKLDEILKAYEYTRTTYRIEERKDRGIKESKIAHQFLETYFFKNPKKEFAKDYTDSVAQLARDMWTEGQIDEARKLLLDAVKNSPKVASLDQVYWVLGRMDQEKKDYAHAIEYFEKALKEDPEKEFQLKLLWLVGWNARKNNQLEKSLEGFDALRRKSDDPEFENYYFKSLFWKAMDYRDLKKEDKATELLKKIAEENPFGYYGRLATLETNPGVFENTLSLQVKVEPNDVVEPARERTIKALLAMSESEILSEYLTSLWRNIGKYSRKKTATKIQFLAWSDESELYKENQQIIEIFEPDSKAEIFEKAPSLLYPEPYLEIVEKYSKKFRVPQELTYSIMRQESLFDKKARSQADAFGLLQLLPSLAEKHMEEAGVKFSTADELYKPEIILPLGIAHLRQLLKIFDDSMLLTAAGYNAGVNQVKGWVKSRYNGNSYEFIEDIPYLETESYAKLVFRNLSFYVQFNKNLDAKSKVALLNKYFKIKGPVEK
jgi:soluble lytic murein transglycosylase